MIYDVHVTFEGELIDTIKIDTDDAFWDSANSKHSTTLDIYEAVERHYLNFINKHLLKSKQL